MFTERVGYLRDLSLFDTIQVLTYPKLELDLKLDEFIFPKYFIPKK